jgi:hypothetical protein
MVKELNRVAIALVEATPVDTINIEQSNRRELRR